MNWFARSKQYRASEAVGDPLNIQLEHLLGYEALARHLNLNGFKPRAKMSGQHVSKQKGRGVMFDEVRQYQPGDDVRNIDWKVTARTEKVHTKLYREEHERPIWLFVDLSASMFFGSTETFKSVLACHIAALVSWLALQQHDKVGLLVQTGQQLHSFKPVQNKRGILNHFSQLIQLHQQHLATPQPANTHAFQHALATLDQLAHSGSLLVLLSDFYQLDQHSEQRLHKLSRQHHVSLAHVFDPLETASPTLGWLGVSDGQQVQLINSSAQRTQQLWQQQWHNQQQRLHGLNQRYGTQYNAIATSVMANDIQLLTALQSLFRKLNK